MKKFLINYILYIYINFIKDEDIEIFKNWAKPFVKITLFIRSIYVWFASIIFLPLFLFGMIFENKIKEISKDYQKIINIYLN